MLGVERVACGADGPDEVVPVPHVERLTEKKHRIEVLRALLEMHQQQHEPDDEYIKGLRQRLKGAQKQLENMRPF